MAVGYQIFSGGLDSMLAVAVLRDQGVDVRLLTFVTPFFGAERARRSAQALGLETRPVDITASHLEMMMAPKHGFGRFANPCIDCHALMFRRAGEIMTAEGGDFLFSGEVLGQRPKSQNRRALDIVAHASGYAEVILRPLSALLLPPTRPEAEGLVDRERLLGLSGRTRKPQMELAEKYGLSDYPSPAGGCLLTDPIFSRRLKEVMARTPEGGPLDPHQVELLKWGRHFRLPGGAKLVVGRNRGENETLEGLAEPGDTIVKAAGFPGPSVILSGSRASAEDLETAAGVTLAYSDAPEGTETQVRLIESGRERVVQAVARPKKEFAEAMV